jgi:hypothetical protein
MPFYERQPYIQPLQSIMQEVLRGEILVPRFQRPGTEVTWSQEQRQALLDSIYRGFPVGTILLWTTVNTDISSFDTVGGFNVPKTSEGKLKRYLLDGHQRLSTLVQILGIGLSETDQLPNEECREWWFFDLTGRSADSKENFICLNVEKSDDPMHLPLAILLNRSALNRWIREQELDDELTGKAETLRDCIRDYPMPVAILQSEDLAEAAESFKRVNSSGTRMGDFNMVAALAFQTGFDLQEIFANAREEYLEPIRWNSISDSDLLRACAAIADKEPTTLKVEALAKQLRSDPEIVAKAFRSIVLAISALKGCGIHGPEMLPYTWQLIVMATALRDYSSIGIKAQKALERWFWITTYGGVFATGNKSVVYSQSKQALLEMMHDGTETAMERYIRRNVYLLNRFDFRAGRAKACVLTMARLHDGNDKDGAAHKALVLGTNALQVLPIKGGQRSTWWHLVIETEYGVVAAIRSEAKAGGWLSQSNALIQFGLNEIDDDDILPAMESRRDQIQSAEKHFVEELGFTWIGRSA